jgi:hypothetical protein
MESREKELLVNPRKGMCSLPLYLVVVFYSAGVEGLPVPVISFS